MVNKKITDRSNSKRPLIIDFHGHIVSPSLFKLTQKFSLHARIGLGKKTSLGKVKESQETMKRMVDPKVRLQDLDKMGVDIQVISPSLIHHNTTSLDGETADTIVRQVNDHVAESVEKYPDRLVGIGIVPLQNLKKSAQELDRMVKKLGLKGVQIPTILNDVEIGDKHLHPFWRKAEKLNIPVFIHPAGNSNPRLRKFGLAFTLGQPYEEALAMSSIVYEGVLDKFPNLKIVIAHGGGFLPYYTGRQDSAFREKRDGAKLKGDFSSYIRKFYYETVVFNPDMLEFLATKTSNQHILMGTDYPFGERDPYRFIRRAKKLSINAQNAILGRNAAKLLGLKI